MKHALWMLLRHPINTLAIGRRVEITAVHCGCSSHYRCPEHEKPIQ